MGLVPCAVSCQDLEECGARCKQHKQLGDFIQDFESEWETFVLVADSFQSWLRYTYFGEAFCCGVLVGFVCGFFFSFLFLGVYASYDHFEQLPYFSPAPGSRSQYFYVSRVPRKAQQGAAGGEKRRPRTPGQRAEPSCGWRGSTAGAERSAGFRAAPPRARPGRGLVLGRRDGGRGRGGAAGRQRELRSAQLLLPLTGALPAPLRHFVGGAERRPRARPCPEPRSGQPRPPPRHGAGSARRARERRTLGKVKGWRGGISPGCRAPLLFRVPKSCPGNRPA